MRMPRFQTRQDRTRNQHVAYLAHCWWKVPQGWQVDLMRARPDVYFTISTLVAWHNVEHDPTGHKGCPR